jgi:hypothetical protein
MNREELDKLRKIHETKGLRLDTASGLSGSIYAADGSATAPVTALLDECTRSFDKDAEITKLKSQLEEARCGLKIALHALKNVDGPFIEHEGAHGIFLAKEHDCTCWDAEQTVTAFLNGSAK